MTRHSISIFLLVVGLLRIGLVSWLFVALGGAANLNPAYIGKALLWYSWLFVGPLLLIVGAVLVMMGTRHRTGPVLSLVGCIILTLMVGYQIVSVLHDAADPLIAKPPYAEYAIVVILTLLADGGVMQLYRLAAQAAKK